MKGKSEKESARTQRHQVMSPDLFGKINFPAVHSSSQLFAIENIAICIRSSIKFIVH